MCGINAIIKKDGSLESLDAFRIHEMHRATKHRGTRKIVQKFNDSIICFNWLPIVNEEMQYLPNKHNGTVVYLNGYISNYKELAKKYDIELENDSDIEFLAKFIDLKNDTFPILNKTKELNGFFAVLYWSDFYKSWFHFTDRYGIKQLYRYEKDGLIYISSEVKGILAACPEIGFDESGIEDWKCTLGVMNEDTIYKGITRIGKLPFVIPEKIEISYDDAKYSLYNFIWLAINRNVYHEDSGVYLSGGIDSGIIAKFMNPKFSFSIDYVDENYSEIDLIKKNSNGIHYSMICNKKFANHYSQLTMQALDDLKAGSCYTNFALAEMASKHVKVVYSGAGGDEFFGGYPHRKKRPIEDSIDRRSEKNKIGTFEYPHVSHFEYDLKFLDAVLVVEDRMNAFHTMETRYPLLDNDLVDFALSLPDEYLENKRILKDVCGLHEDVIKGKKRGFSNPYFNNDEWVEFTLENLKR